jgi:hypothetical protein
LLFFIRIIFIAEESDASSFTIAVAPWMLLLVLFLFAAGEKRLAALFITKVYRGGSGTTKECTDKSTIILKGKKNILHRRESDTSKSINA